jgi:hypothetical protein
MIGRGVIIAAVATYLVVVGCVMWPADSAPRLDGETSENGHPSEATTQPFAGAIEAVPHDRNPRNEPTRNGDREGGRDAARPPAQRAKPAGLPYCGVAMQVQRIDLINEYEKNIDEIAALGADTVSIVVDARQENGSSSRIFIDVRMTPTPEQLLRLIGHAKGKGLRVVLMPIVLLDNPRGNEWRGTIRPDSWNDWWDSYRSMIHHYSWIAQVGGVDLLVVGSELVSTESRVDEWRRTINQVRREYKGQLTYSANWDHYNRVGFWDQLDLMGMNSYYKLGNNNLVPVTEIVSRWKEIQNDLLAFQRRIGKPLILLEAGWCSMKNAAHEPWDYTRTDQPVDVELQRKLYEGFFQSWWGNPSLGGFMLWEWPPGEGGLKDKGYSPENKPAQAVAREWLAKPRWQVR